jgi:DNA-directed RNA polymerase subunit RPC12/RpoP
MEVTCSNCGTISKLPDGKVPIGRSYILCPRCDGRITIYRGLKVGNTVKNLIGVRFLRDDDQMIDEFCEPGELWKVVEVLEPCPEKGTGRACERENFGRCPNQRVVVRLRGDTSLYRTCLYRKGRKIFDRGGHAPVGNRPPTSALRPLNPTDDED